MRVTNHAIPNHAATMGENQERIFMPKLPPKMKQHLLLKTPKLRAHIDAQLQLWILLNESNLDIADTTLIFMGVIRREFMDWNAPECYLLAFGSPAGNLNNLRKNMYIHVYCWIYKHTLGGPLPVTVTTMIITF